MYLTLEDECEQIKDDYINKEDEDAQNNAVLFAKDIKLNTKSSSLSNQLISLFSGTFIDTNTNDLFIKTDQLKSFFISTYIEDTTPLANYIEILQSKSTKDIHENSDTYVPKGYKNSIYSKSLDSLNIEYFDVESILRKYFDSQAQAKGFKVSKF